MPQMVLIVIPCVHMQGWLVLRDRKRAEARGSEAIASKPLSRNTAQVPLGFSAALLAVIVNVWSLNLTTGDDDKPIESIQTAQIAARIPLLKTCPFMRKKK
ncbi:hypothetical protein FVEG_11141 [Fusarium verticillioides 7600]|uniref:Uncharacterized protein n=1 Tax=Gibberella moniliformis (strain M3125 / FGSC 7600) TaxID=334819 RepID=W7MLL7_GIBM7|nr:hypothetical protein FVEG_11141 [Fusarium verticillioides 7600]EWG52373.1 hypothetical protein FVEG_11141 [Fusarium verticillioides 7600]